MDYEEDYWQLRTVLRILGHYADKNEILNLFKKNENMHEINWFRTFDYLKGTGGVI